MTATIRDAGVFDHPDFDGHETVSFATDAASGLRAIVCVHDTTLGPALGGCRRWTYARNADALSDVLRLSAGMTLKNAAAGLDFGGGKAVILSDGKPANAQIWRAFGRAVELLGGSYITAEDVGTGQDAVDRIAETTAHVRGTSGDGLGDPSPFTAQGVFAGIRAAARHRLGAETLDGLTVAVQGIGNVGAAAARLARADGARLIIADIRDDAVRALSDEIDAAIAPVATVHTVAADIFVPCALGGALNAQTIPELRASVVAGAANNQLSDDEDGMRLARRGILYAPDFVINAGGVISIALAERFRTSDAMRGRVNELGHVLGAIFDEAEASGSLPVDVAIARARARLEAGAKSAA